MATLIVAEAQARREEARLVRDAEKAARVAVQNQKKVEAATKKEELAAEKRRFDELSPEEQRAERSAKRRRMELGRARGADIVEAVDAAAAENISNENFHLFDDAIAEFNEFGCELLADDYCYI